MKRKMWTKLDNAGKIFPPSVNGTDSQVFRLSCTLDEDIVPDILQKALLDTAKAIPSYQQVLKKGMFWYYLESTEALPKLKEEYKTPCAIIFNKYSKGLLYEITYYNNRINLEVFHALSDGMGAVFFLTTLVTKYLSLKNKIEEPPLVYSASHTQLNVDSFYQYYDNKINTKSLKLENSCRIRGIKSLENNINVITGYISVKQIHQQAKQNNTTITGILCTLLMLAINDNISVRARRKPVVIAVPINLRSTFPSKSARNFFSVMYVSYNFSKNSNAFEEVLSAVDKQLKDGLTPESLNMNVNRYAALEHNVIARIVPLPVKNFFMRKAYLLSRRKVTAALSNIGIIKMPPQFDNIKGFELYSGTDSIQACVCSYKDRLSIGFTTPFISSDIQQSFFRNIVSKGIDVEVSSNTISYQS